MLLIKNGLLSLSILVLSLTFSFADKYPKNPKIDILNYAFRIELSDETDEIKCEETIDVSYLGEGVNVLRLDLTKSSEALEGKGMTVSRVLSGGKELDYIHEGDQLKINLPEASQLNQRTSYTVIYSGIPATGLKIAKNKYGDRTFFSDNWPDKARNWLAVIDHPYDKATSEFIVIAPNHYQVVSNGLMLEETDLGNGKRLTHWKQSIPIASWLYVLGVAEFAVQHVDDFEGKAIQTWVYRQDRDAGFYDFAEPTKKALEYYSDYIGPFSYEKLANIQSNSVSGGMEAASAILYSENSVVGDRNERWRNVVIHEIAHQWFGNAVTEYDWDDVWLSEGFATYFTSLFIEHEYGHDAFMRQMASSKERVLSFNEKNPDYRIVHDNLEDMSQVTTGQTYQKGSWILHMLRGVVGTENFWKGIRNYYTKYQNLNSTTTDFRIEMEAASGMNLERFFDQWLYKSGALKIYGDWGYNKKSQELRITLDQVQKDRSLFEMPIQVAIYEPGKSAPTIETVIIKSQSDSFTFSLDYEPERIILDPESWVLMESTINKTKF
ncbi:M1 family aminopeptidase [Algoriphagus sp. SE2]|uniref:M1 family metallopeptidase n=1 Tax=Algoriphagus sp. SE2 TaxID=3141536 RepID=UPI0031CD5298